MKRRSFFAVLTAPLALLWPRESADHGSGRTPQAKQDPPCKPSAAEIFGAAHEAGISFQIKWGTNSGGTLGIWLSTRMPPNPTIDFPVVNRTSVWSFDESPSSDALAGCPYDEVLGEIASRLLSAMTPEQKKCYDRCLSKRSTYPSPSH